MNKILLTNKNFSLSKSIDKVFKFYKDIQKVNYLINPQDQYSQSIRKMNMFLYAHLLNEYNKNIKVLLESQDYFDDIQQTIKQYGFEVTLDEENYSYKFQKNVEDYLFTFEILKFENERIFNLEKSVDEEQQVKEILFDSKQKNDFYIIKNERFIKSAEKEAEIRLLKKKLEDYNQDAIIDDVFKIRVPDDQNLDFKIHIKHRSQKLTITGYITDLYIKKQSLF